MTKSRGMNLQPMKEYYHLNKLKTNFLKEKPIIQAQLLLFS